MRPGVLSATIFTGGPVLLSNDDANRIPLCNGGDLQHFRAVQLAEAPHAPGATALPIAAGECVPGVVQEICTEEGASVAVFIIGEVYVEVDALVAAGEALQVNVGGTFGPDAGGVLVARALQPGAAGDVIKVFFKGCLDGIATTPLIFRSWGGGIFITSGDETFIEAE